MKEGQIIRYVSIVVGWLEVESITELVITDIYFPFQNMFSTKMH
jgi:hypothetical protein